MTQPSIAQFTFVNDNTINCDGDWTHQGIIALSNNLIKNLNGKSKNKITIKGNQIKSMDSIGAWRLNQLLQQLEQKGWSYQLQGFKSEYTDLITWLEAQDTAIPTDKRKYDNIFTVIGKRTVDGLLGFAGFLAFLGELVTTLAYCLRHLQSFRWRSLIYGIEVTGYQALPIVMLLTFLVGVVLTYQIGVQLSHYGANIFVVDLLGISLLREFAPLLTAIIIAGRTGSSYTAQLGTMKLNQEFDALQTMGLSPMHMLVLPRVFALLIALPLLTVVADCVGVIGGMIMSRSMLGLSFIDFLSRFSEVVSLKNYVIGLIKTPVFALLIAAIGCYQGFQVHASATSVGQRTTTSVVQAIFAIITADAAFSVLFSYLGI